MNQTCWRHILGIVCALVLLRCENSGNPEKGRGILWVSPQVVSSLLNTDLLSRTPRPCDINNPTIDPLFSFQWHLENTGQPMYRTNFVTGIPGEDINVKPVWNTGNFGQSITVSVVDDGLDLDHEDLIDNITNGSRNFLTNNGFPSNHPGGILAAHGTSVAGIIAGRGQNGVGITGVSPCSHLVGYNFLSSPTTSNLTTSLSSNSSIAVSNNSWGSEDGTGLLAYPIQIWRDAIQEGISRSRGGLGTSYVWAAGNGHFGTPAGNNLVDNSNYDGYVNHPGVITVAAVTNQGRRASYSERGANLWVSSYSGEPGNTSITTTDLTGDNWGYNPGGVSPNTSTSSNNYLNLSYTNSFNGTSAAAPSVSGIVALLLKERPDLSYRDIKLILAGSGRKVDPADPDWKSNSQGIFFNPSFGFGIADASLAVTLSKSWNSVGGFQNQRIFTSPLYGNVNLTNGSTVTVSVPIAGSQISRIEYVELIVDITHGDTGKLEIEVESPHPSSGNRSKVYERHLCYSQKNRTGGLRLCNPIQGFSFGISQYLDEPANGTWRVHISNFHTASGWLNSLRLRFYGR